MSGVSIKCVGLSHEPLTVDVRLSHGEFLIAAGAGFLVSGAVRDLGLAGEAIRFSPVSSGHLSQSSVEIGAELRKLADGDPVIEIGIDRGMFARVWEPSQQELGAQLGSMFGQNPSLRRS